MCWALNVDWDATGSMMGGIGDLIVGGATAALAVFAYFGLSAWRTQLVGTRKVDVGETLLRHMYEVDEILKYITAPFMHAGELAKVEREEGESDDDYRLRQNYEAVNNRYQTYIERFNELRAACFAAKATLGDDVYEAAIEVVKFPNHILSAASSVRFAEQVVRRLDRQMSLGIQIDERQWRDANDRFDKAHEYFYGLDDDNKLQNKRESLVKKVEELVRKAIQ